MGKVSLIIELWKKLDLHDYYVSNTGKVMNCKTKKVLKNRIDTKGYNYVDLYDGKGNAKRYLLHRLVASLFVEGDNSLQVNHIDGVPTNNRFDNLEWVTAKQNSEHAVKIGLTPRCEKHHLSKLTDTHVTEIRILYSNGISQNEISSIYGIDQSVVSRYVNRKRGGAYR